ncbi:hypothetical protein GCM10022231_15290 [Gordonia caeni]|uniref:Uncharacterized protein n=1 Tax=Gordonia caeni TaxID=1007097 RepID=A0ABP7NZE0_9ACTN
MPPRSGTELKVPARAARSWSLKSAQPAADSTVRAPTAAARSARPEAGRENGRGMTQQYAIVTKSSGGDVPTGDRAHLQSET